MSSSHSLQAAYQSFQAGNLQQARQQIRACITASSDANALHLGGVIEKAAGNFEQAATWLRQAAAMAPTNAEILNTLGIVETRLGNTVAAESSYRSALKAAPSFVPALLNLAHHLAQSASGATEAEAMARKIIQLQGKSGAGWAALGAALKSQSRFEEALSAFDQAAAQGATDPATWQNRAGVLLELGRTRETAEILDALAQAGIDNAALSYLRGRVHVEEGDIEAGATQMARSWTTQTSEHALRNLASVYWMQGDTGSFDALLEEALATQTPQLALIAVDLTRQSGRVERAAELFNSLNPEQQSTPGAQSLGALLAQETGALETAVERARSAIAEAPDSYGVRTNLIVPLLMLGDAQDALIEIEAAQRLAPLAQDLIAYQATAWRMLGRTEAYERLYDMERFVIPHQLEAPEGYASMADFNAALAAELDALRVYKAHPLDQSLRLGNQTPRDLLHESSPVIRSYFQALEKPIRAYMQAIGSDPDHPLTARNTGRFALKGSWSVRLASGGFHVNHVHPEGWISSAYYVEVPEGIETNADRAGWIKFGEPSFATPVPLPAEKWVCPKPGSLVLFPSYMWHGTEPIESGATRVTAPFDVLPV